MPASDPSPKQKERRFFLCTGQCVKYKDLYKYPSSHIIGELGYVLDEDRRVTALLRWDVSVSAAVVPPIKPVIDSEIIGDARRIKCRYEGCYQRQRWEIGKAGFEQLMRRYRKGAEAVENSNEEDNSIMPKVSNIT